MGISVYLAGLDFMRISHAHIVFLIYYFLRSELLLVHKVSIWFGVSGESMPRYYYHGPLKLVLRIEI